MTRGAVGWVTGAGCDTIVVCLQRDNVRSRAILLHGRDIKCRCADATAWHGLCNSPTHFLQNPCT